FFVIKAPTNLFVRVPLLQKILSRTYSFLLKPPHRGKGAQRDAAASIAWPIQKKFPFQKQKKAHPQPQTGFYP
ncbi:MAG: hypothetical protein Q4F42_06165, partial [Rikenellaceae bacterium]|nr:hypothetical protein [Rikenellaceae bacterium]